LARAAVLAVLACLAAAALAPSRAPAAEAGKGAGPYPVASAVRVGGNGQQTRFVLDLSHKIDIAVFSLADPYRVVVDLPQITFKLPRHAGEHGRGLVTAYRYGLVMRGGSRIVLDTSKPVSVKKAFVLPAAAGQPARLVLDLAATDRATFLHNIALQDRDDRAKRPPQVAAEAPRSSDPRPLIVLDPGHGGIDTGTHWDGIDEKNVVLAFGLDLRRKLEHSGKYRVLMTRSDDTYITLGDRVRFARSHRAALFISLHADSLPPKEGHAEGATVYTLSEKASDAQAAELANSENSSDILAGVDLSKEPSDVASILVDLAQRETKTYSVQFARDVVNELRDTARLYKHPMKSAGFVVLKDPDVPSVLIELGYLSSAADRKNLNSPAWRNKTAGALADAIDAFFAPRLATTGGPR
jgi:N-acetylmuramoyl-L-alanine amidase